MKLNHSSDTDKIQSANSNIHDAAHKYNDLKINNVSTSGQKNSIKTNLNKQVIGSLVNHGIKM